jgi:hypothetical protein
VGGLRDLLTIANKSEDHEYRWVNASVAGRIQWLEERGWEVVKDDLKVGQTTVDSPSGKIGSALTRFGGGNVTLVAMRIPKEWYDEDQARKQELVNDVEETMQRDAREGRIPGSNQAGYTPDGGGINSSVSVQRRKT